MVLDSIQVRCSAQSKQADMLNSSIQQGGYEQNRCCSHSATVFFPAVT